MERKFFYKEKQRGCPLLGANRYTHIYIYQLYMCIYIIYLFETIYIETIYIDLS